MFQLSITLEPGINKVNRTQSYSQVAYSLVEKANSNDVKRHSHGITALDCHV